LEKQGLLGMLSAIKGGGLENFWTETEVYRCKQGNDSLATAFARAIGQGRIHLNTPAADVAIRDHDVQITDAHKGKWTAEHVVLAVPPSTWSMVSFNPPLPNGLMPQMGVNVKFLARLRREVWLPASPDALTSDFVSETWHGTDQQTQDGDICLVGFSGSTAATDALARHHASGAKDFADLLSAIYPRFSARFVDSRFMDWPNETWTKAGYSNAAPGEITRIGKTLYEGIGRLHFAGEHTCYQFPGFMEVALRAGVRVAGGIGDQQAAAKQ
jgi:monoamine oxidase